jgi:Holliday junction resolvase RusA-like endonuclease
MIQFEIEGPPVPWGRVTPVLIPAGKGRKAHVQMVTPKETRESEAALRRSSIPFRPRKPLDGPLGLDTVFVIAPPQSFPADRSRDWPHIKPDDDNYRKLVLDAFNKIFWHDDGQICGGSSWKVYGSRPRIFIRIWQLGRDDLGLVHIMLGEETPQLGMFQAHGGE